MGSPSYNGAEARRLQRRRLWTSAMTRATLMRMHRDTYVEFAAAVIDLATRELISRALCFAPPHRYCAHGMSMLVAVVYLAEWRHRPLI